MGKMIISFIIGIILAEISISKCWLGLHDWFWRFDKYSYWRYKKKGVWKRHCQRCGARQYFVYHNNGDIWITYPHELGE